MFNFDPIIDAAPVVTISRPLSKGTETTYVDLAGTASDYHGVVGVNYVITDATGKDVSGGVANQSIGTGTPSKVNWSVNHLFLPPGPLTLTVTAYDTLGNTSTPVTQTFSVVPSALQPGKFTTSTPVLGHEDKYMSPAPTVLASAISGSFAGARITKARLLEGGTVPNAPGDASGWWIASEITPGGEPVTADPGGPSYYASGSTTTSSTLVSKLGGSAKVPTADTMLISPLILMSPPLIQSDGFTLVYAFAMQFYSPFGDDAFGARHGAVGLKMHVNYKLRDPTGFYRLPFNQALLADLQNSNFADIASLNSILIYSDAINALGSGWVMHKPGGTPSDGTLQVRWNKVFGETSNLTNNAVSMLGQERPAGHANLNNFAFVARKRPTDFIAPVSSYPAVVWRQRDEEWVKSQSVNIGINLWGAARADVTGGSLVLGTGGSTPPVTGSDRAAPSIKITSPQSNARVPFSTSITLTGTATDNLGVAVVEVRPENSDTWTQASSITPPNGKSITWSATLTGLPPGPMTFYARAKDAAGNISAEVKVSITIVRLRTLTTSVAGQGVITTSFSPTSVRDAGVSYTITATPAKGWRFSKWTGSAVPAALAAISPLTFPMPDADSDLNAVFVADTAAGLAGVFDLQFGAEPTPLQSGGSAFPQDFGRLQLTTTITGGFSGTLTVATQNPASRGVFTVSVSGALDGGFAYSGILRPSGKPPVLLQFVIDSSGASPVCKGLIKVGTGLQIVIGAHRAALFSKTSPCPRAGLYQLSLTPPAPSDLVQSLSPTNGWGTLVIDSLGHATTLLRGPLQSTVVTVTTGLTEGDDLIFAAAMSLGGSSHPAGTVAGWCSGLWSFTPSTFDGPATWLPLVAPNALVPDISPVEWQIVGPLYTAPAAGQPILAWAPGTTNNAFLEYWANEHVPDAFKFLTLSATNTMTAYQPTGTGFTLKLDATKGTFTGTIPVAGRSGTQSFQGIFIPDQSSGIGSLTGGFVRIRLSTASDTGLALQTSRRVVATGVSLPESTIPTRRVASGFTVPNTGFTLHLIPDGIAATDNQMVLTQGSTGLTMPRGWQLLYDGATTPTLRLVVTGDSVPSSHTLSTSLPSDDKLTKPVTLVAEPDPMGGFNLRLYVDGTEMGSATITNLSAFQTNAPLIFGTYFDGGITELRLWNRIFTDSEIMDLVGP